MVVFENITVMPRPRQYWVNFARKCPKLIKFWQNKATIGQKAIIDPHLKPLGPSGRRGVKGLFGGFLKDFFRGFLWDFFGGPTYFKPWGGEKPWGSEGLFGGLFEGFLRGFFGDFFSTLKNHLPYL